MILHILTCLNPIKKKKEMDSLFDLIFSIRKQHKNQKKIQSFFLLSSFHVFYSSKKRIHREDF